MTRGDGSNHSHDFPNRLRKVLTEETVTEPEQRARINTPSLHQLTSTSGWYCSLSGPQGNGSHPHQSIKHLGPGTNQAELYDTDHVTIVEPRDARGTCRGPQSAVVGMRLVEVGRRTGVLGLQTLGSDSRGLKAKPQGWFEKQKQGV